MAVSYGHDGLVELFRKRPGLSAELLGLIGVQLPEYRRVRSGPAGMAGSLPGVPGMMAVDHLSLFELPRPGLTPDEQVTAAVLNEVQLSPPNRKLPSWLVYRGMSAFRYPRAQVELLVVAMDDEIAADCAAAYRQPGLVMRSRVIGPSQLPVVTHGSPWSGDLQMSVLSAAAHGKGPRAVPVFAEFLDLLASIDRKVATSHTTTVLEILKKHPNQKVLAEMLDRSKYTFASEAINDWMAQGLSQGERQAVLEVLSARGLALSAADRSRLDACADQARLTELIRRAAVIDSAAELFGHPDGGARS